MTAKAFLLDECQNIRALLDKTLRFDYGVDGSAKFYEECSARLDFLQQALSASDVDDLKRLGKLSAAINDLSRLICRIERSSVNEYSWPFVEELRQISSAICTENTIDNPDSPLSVFVLADGGLNAYQIYPEPRRPGYVRNRLLTIVFPKTLKDFVLLHSILGHEIGHAVFRCSKHEAAIRSEVISHICHPGGQFADKDSTAAYIFDPSSPADVALALAALGITRANIFAGVCDWGAWVEEVLCDLIGLVTFGPAFVAAEASLLYSLDLTGTTIGPRHPLVAWRINLLRRGSALLKFDTIPAGDSAFAKAVSSFWVSIDQFVKPDPWFNVIDDASLLKALHGLQTLLGAHPPAKYLSPDEDGLLSLFDQISKHVPPVGFSISEDGIPKCQHIDFRHILFAGWIAAKNPANPMPFELANKLCQHAIMQQRAITISMKSP